MVQNNLIPPIPPQYFDETDFQQLGFEHEELDYKDGELYTDSQEGDQLSQR